MERKKTTKLVITFPTTTAAMTMDDVCAPEQGRLIPIPREISGGCGLAWCAKPDDETTLLEIMADNHIVYQEKRLLELY